jgi:hypothetical protein
MGSYASGSGTNPVRGWVWLVAARELRLMEQPTCGWSDIEQWIMYRHDGLPGAMVRCLMSAEVEKFEIVSLPVIELHVVVYLKLFVVQAISWV